MHIISRETPLILLSSNCPWLLRNNFYTRDLLVRISALTVGSALKKTYLVLQGAYERVTWIRLLCNNRATPKNKFILWLTLLNRLATLDRISKWNTNCDPVCKLCNEHHESVHHLFFSCSTVVNCGTRSCNTLITSPRASA